MSPKLLAIALLPAACLAADEIPGWVREAAATGIPTYPSKVAMVTLLQEERVSVEADGRRVIRERGVVRLLQQAKEGPIAYRSYNTKSGRIREFHGWLLDPGGGAVAYPKSAIVDVALNTDYTYDEARARTLRAGGDLAAGTTFAWEAVEEEKTVFTQYRYVFQSGHEPAIVSRFILGVPAGWEVKGTMFNHAPLEAQTAGNEYTWELRNLPWIEPEEASPELNSLAPWLGANYYPAAETNPDLHAVKDWTSASVWLSGLVDPSSTVTESIRTKSAELTSGASTEIDRIKAIAAFTQKTNYISVQMNLERGGGYTPHRAEEVLARNYGDCKDKVALMRALLDAAGIKSYTVVVDSRDRLSVRPEWASPAQFNHAIVAIAISPATKVPSVVDHPRLGRLLIFDPTDDATPVGDLPANEQGSHALVLAGSKGSLLTMPSLPPEMSRVESVSEAHWGEDGQLSASVVRDYFGQSATGLRRSIMRQDSDALKKRFERRLSSQLGALTLNRIEPLDRMAQDGFQLTMDFTVRKFGEVMQEKLLVVSPGALIPNLDYGFPARPRASPIRLEGYIRKDRVSITLPPSFKVDELPDAVKIDTAYGDYRAAWKVDGNRLTFEHEIKVNQGVSPASEYPQVRAFFAGVAAGQHSAVVLLKR